MNKSKFIFTGVLVKEKSSVTALCLELDVVTEGNTTEQAKNNLMEAVSLYIETAIENNLPIMRPVPEEENPLVIQSKQILEKFPLKIDFEIHAYA